ncbi:MAG: hypothetical protein HC806_08860 [Anaerolineae bacterium]|nr:hypothetical protein [Anaerolineae bacterium]
MAATSSGTEEIIVGAKVSEGISGSSGISDFTSSAGTDSKVDFSASAAASKDATSFAFEIIVGAATSGVRLLGDSSDGDSSLGEVSPLAAESMVAISAPEDIIVGADDSGGGVFPTLDKSPEQLLHSFASEGFSVPQYGHSNIWLSPKKWYQTGSRD